MISQRSVQQLAQPNVASAIQGVLPDEQQGVRPSPQQQVSRPSNNGDDNPRPIQAPRNHQAIGNLEDNKNDDAGVVNFVNIGSNVVPAGPDEVNAQNKPDSEKASLPLPYYRKIEKNERDVESVGDSPRISADPKKSATSSSKATKTLQQAMKFVPVAKPQGIENSQIRPEDPPRAIPSGRDEIQDLENKVAGILNNEK